MSGETPRDAAHPAALLIPWYAQDRLGVDERRLVEEHLAACASCRELLEEAREQLDWQRSPPPDDPLGHVHPRLLTQYVEQPEALDRETRLEIEERLRSCTVCREAAERLEEVGRALARESGAAHAAPERAAAATELRERLGSLWAALAGSVLRPAPALAYLAALLVLLPATWMLRRPATDGLQMVSAPDVILAEPERTLRTGGAGRVDPLRVPVPEERAAPVILELDTGFDEAILEAPETAFSVELRRDGTTLWTRRLDRGEITRRDGAALLPLLLYPGRLEPDTDHEILVRVMRPGDPLDGQALFRRTLRITTDPS